MQGREETRGDAREQARVIPEPCRRASHRARLRERFEERLRDRARERARVRERLRLGAWCRGGRRRVGEHASSRELKHVSERGALNYTHTLFLGVFSGINPRKRVCV